MMGRRIIRDIDGKRKRIGFVMEGEYSQNGLYIFKKLSKTNFIFLKKGENPIKLNMN